MTLQALIQAVKNNQPQQVDDILNQLIQTDAVDCLNDQDEDGKTIMHYIAEYGRLEILQKVKKSVRKIKFSPKNWNIGPHHLAAKNNHVNVLTEYLGYKIDVDSLDEDGYTALHYAAEKNHYECVVVTLKWGADLFKKTKKESKTAIELASDEKIKKLFQDLIPAFSKLQQATRLPFLNACRNQSAVNWPRYGKEWEDFKEVVGAALSHQNQDVRDITKRQCQSMLLKKTSNNAPDQLLFLLLAAGIEDVVEFLLQYGIDFTGSTYRERLVTNYSKKYLGLYCAIEYRQMRVIEVLLKTEQRILTYLHPFKLLKTAENTLLTPLEYVQQLRRKEQINGGNKNKLMEFERIINLLTKKESEYQNITSADKVETFLENIHPQFLSSTALSVTTLSQLAFSKSVNHFNEEEYESEQDYVLRQHKNALKGVLGEFLVYSAIENKYLKKYEVVSYDPDFSDGLGFSMTARYKSESAKKSKNINNELKIEVIWHNKKEFEGWLKKRKKDKNLPFKDPATKSFDIEIKKNDKRRFCEVKTTEYGSKTTVIVSGNEVNFMRKHYSQYRFFRVERLYYEQEIQKIKPNEYLFDDEEKCKIQQLKIKL